LILVLISNFFFKGLWSREIMEGSIAYFLALIHTLYIVTLLQRSRVRASFKLKLASTFVLALVEKKLIQ